MTAGVDELLVEPDLRLHGDVRAADLRRALDVLDRESARRRPVAHRRAQARGRDDDLGGTIDPSASSTPVTSALDDDPFHAVPVRTSAPPLRRAARTSRDRDRASLRIAERVVPRHFAKALRGLARRDLPEREDEVEAEQEAEDSDRRRVIGERLDELFDRAVVPLSTSSSLIERMCVKSFAARTASVNGEVQRKREVEREARHPREIGRDPHAREPFGRPLALPRNRSSAMSCVRMKSDRAASLDSAKHVAERALAAAEHVGADVDVESLLVVAGTRSTESTVLLDQRDLHAGVSEKQRRRCSADRPSR